MLEQPQYPIDDNTLFILLALRYQGKIEIDGLDSVYDKNINYDFTEIKQDKNRIRSMDEFADAGIDWIVKTFGVIKTPDGDKITLELEDAKKLEEYLDKYLDKFNPPEPYYMNESFHKKVFCEFIEKEFEDIVEHKKVFPYRFTQSRQYKMIEYIGYLMNQGILSTTYDKEIFTFDNDDTYTKVIKLKFADEYNIKKFINKGQKHQNGIFYTFDKDTKVYFIKDGEQKEVDIRKGLLQFLKKCIVEKLSSVNLKSYEGFSKKQLDDDRVRRYYDELDSALQNIVGQPTHNFFDNKNRSGVWELNFYIEQ